MIYVFPHYNPAEEHLKDKNVGRLFAYPSIPINIDNKNIVILDSGGYGMSQAGKKISLNYMKKLSRHYEKYNRDNVICVAPDEWMNAGQTILYLKKWHNNNLFKSVVPVLQDERKGVVNVENMMRQAEFYRKFSDKIMYSNNGIYGNSHMATKVNKVVKHLKEKLGYKYIHLLGAGWNLEDVRAWAKSEWIDSIDSIAYYTSSKEFGANTVIEAIDNVIKVFK